MRKNAYFSGMFGQFKWGGQHFLYAETLIPRIKTTVSPHLNWPNKRLLLKRKYEVLRWKSWCFIMFYHFVNFLHTMLWPSLKTMLCEKVAVLEAYYSMFSTIFDIFIFDITWVFHAYLTSNLHFTSPINDRGIVPTSYSVDIMVP